MTTPFVDHRVVSECVELLRQGKRFCVACGFVRVMRFAPGFVVRCDTCYNAKRPASFCSKCGEHLMTCDPGGVRWYRDKSLELRECDRCRRWNPPPHPELGVHCPRYWRLPVEKARD